MTTTSETVVAEVVAAVVDDTSSADFTFKLIVIGDIAVGKSCILQRFVNHKFSSDSTATIGVDFEKKTVEIDGERIKLLIWDTAGHERFRAVTRSYYRSAMGALLCFDITQRSSYTSLHDWLCATRSMSNPNIPILLIGNKCDMEERRDVSFDEATKFANENQIVYAECSAKSGYNIDEMFTELARIVHRKLLDGSLGPSPCVLTLESSIDGDDNNRSGKRCTKC